MIVPLAVILIVPPITPTEPSSMLPMYPPWVPADKVTLGPAAAGHPNASWVMPPRVEVMLPCGVSTTMLPGSVATVRLEFVGGKPIYCPPVKTAAVAGANV